MTELKLIKNTAGAKGQYTACGQGRAGVNNEPEFPGGGGGGA